MTPPILGIWASSVTGGVSAATAYESIATVSVGSGGTSSINFSSIPGTYSHLQIRGILRSNASASGGEYFVLKFNSDSGSNYAWHYLGGNQTVVYSGGSSSNIYIAGSQTAASGGDLSNTFGGCIIDILDYANTNKYKTVRTLNGWDDNGDGVAGMDSALWMSTSAITSMAFTPGSGTLWSQYSHLALYGIKAA